MLLVRAMTCLRGAALGLPLLAAAFWLASVTTTGAPPATAEPAAAPAAGTPIVPWFDLERQRARLERLTAAPPVSPSRNPFRFGSRPRRASTAPLTDRAPDDPAALADRAVPAAPSVPVRLVGIAAGAADDGPFRSAILSGLGQVFIAGAGDLVAERYRVTAVGEDAVELSDEMTGRVLRLALR
jgi:hypothetical protein